MGTHFKLLIDLFGNAKGAVIRVVKEDSDGLYFIDGRGAYSAVSRRSEGTVWEWTATPLGDQLLKEEE